MGAHVPGAMQYLGAQVRTRSAGALPGAMLYLFAQVRTGAQVM